MAIGKASGPDGFLSESFRHSPCLLEPVASLFNSVMGTGCFRCSALQVFLVFLDKPREPMERCDSKRPISLINVLSKALKAVVLHRLMAQLEKSLAGRQYASRRERGAERHLLELADFVSQLRPCSTPS